jgi:2-amino-4-hydroxy-6-hydroxymethyldihydropteridine diphosphokinase
VTAAVALGSNLGDRRAHLDYAVSRLHAVLGHLRVSRYRATEPVGVPEPQRQYLNAAAVGESTMTARQLLEALFAIERERARERPYRGASRTLDLDLILFGGAVVDEPDLVVPHPRFRDRPFVLEPLAEVAPDLRDPISGWSVAELLVRSSSL